MYKIMILYRQGDASCYHRIFNPFRLMDLEDGEQTEFIEKDERLIKKDFKDAKIVIFSRNPTVNLEELLIMKKQYGFKIWMDIDDYWELYEHHYLYDNWKANKMEDLLKKCMDNADIVTTTNVRLLRAISPINSACRVVPNAVPFGIEQFQYQKSDSSYVRFMYVGGPSHYHDLKIIDEFFGMCSRDIHMRNKSKFTLAGYNRLYKEQNLHQMHYIMSRSPNYDFRSMLPIDKYMEHYDHCDISLAPIENNLFNHYKSNLKIIEAGCMKVPVIASGAFPFLEDEEMRDKGIFFCENPKEWYSVAKTLTNYPESVDTAGQILYDYVKRKYNLLEVNKTRREILNWLKRK